MRPVRSLFLALALSASLVLGATSAQAANVVQNPGFEDDCSGVPCDWTGATTNNQGDTISRDTSTHFDGSASLAITSDDLEFNDAIANPNCFAITGPATYNVGFWYRTTDSVVSNVYLSIDAFTSDCSSPRGIGAGSASVETLAPVTSGAWTHVTGTLTTSDNAQSATIDLGWVGQIAKTGAVTHTVNYDDVQVQMEPLAVTVASFAARRSAKGVLLRWRTAAEANLLGFNVFRGGRKVNRQLIRAHGSVSGWRYSFVDRHAPHATLTYRLQALGADGSRRWYGPAHISIAKGGRQ